MSAQEPPIPPAVAAEGATGSRDRSVDYHDRHSAASVRSVLKPRGFRAGVGLGNIARRTLGIFLLLVTVVLWTSSNFLASVSLHLYSYTHAPLSLLTSAVYICRQHLLKALLRHLY